MKKKNKLMITAISALITIRYVFMFLKGSSGRTFTDAEKVEDWLARQKGGASADDPIPFSVKLNLQNMASPESNWQKLLTSINTAGLYVALDLSGSTMPSTEFDADGGTQTGKNFIVSLVLPDIATSVKGVLYGYFRNLKTAGAKQIDFLIGNSGPAGGIIFYDKGEFSDGWRYLEAAPANMETELRWVAESYRSNYDRFPNVVGTGTDIGAGKRNTTLILAVDANAPAAKACMDYRGGGFDDWFLPSRDELDLMYRNLHISGIGGFGDNHFWSSSHHDIYSYGAWLRYFDFGLRYYNAKDLRSSVRAVRAF